MARSQMRSAEVSAKRFFRTIAPKVSWDYTDHRAKPLILGAFYLYAKAWGPDWNIKNWEWPYLELRGERKFDGDQPWAILLRRAVEICDDYATEKST